MDIKQSYQEWKECIFGENKQPFSEEYIRQRLSIFENTEHTEYKKYVATYGKEYTLKIISYFKQALSEL